MGSAFYSGFEPLRGEAQEAGSHSTIRPGGILSVGLLAALGTPVVPRAERALAVTHSYNLVLNFRAVYRPTIVRLSHRCSPEGKKPGARGRAPADADHAAGFAALALSRVAWYVVWSRSNAHAITSSFRITATIACFFRFFWLPPIRRKNARSSGLHRMAIHAAWFRIARSNGLPRFVIRPFRSIWPDCQRRGTSPAYAATCRRVAKRCG